MDKVRFGMLGCGNIGTTHAKIFMKNQVENGVLTAVCDVNPAKIEKIKEIPGMESVATFTDYREMFASGLIDVAIIGVPHYFHPIHHRGIKSWSSRNLRKARRRLHQAGQDHDQ